jgi:hypothetical protein
MIGIDNAIAHSRNNAAVRSLHGSAWGPVTLRSSKQGNVFDTTCFQSVAKWQMDCVVQQSGAVGRLFYQSSMDAARSLRPLLWVNILHSDVALQTGEYGFTQNN